MPLHKRFWSVARRMPALMTALAVLVTGLAVAPPSPASAQDSIYRPWLRDLFAPPRKARRLEPSRGIPGARPRAVKKRSGQSRKTIARKAVERAAEPEAPVPEKLADAKIVLVVGDFLGSGLAEGLAAAYAENPRVKIIDRSNGSSGFVRDDFYDWPAEIPPIIEAEKPAAIVVMLGSNDRQQMRIGGVSEAVRSENWITEYTRRVTGFGQSIAGSKVPFVWVGLPAFKSSKMTSDMLAFNDIYRSSAGSAGSEFIDIWDGFVDENGAFVTTGPDVNGQPVRLRSSDGINLTMSGKRKIAFYMEKPLNKILGETAGGEPIALAPATLPAISPDAPRAAPVNRTVPVSLNDPELDGGTELLGLQAQPKREARSPGETLTIEGIAPAAVTGRADDFSRPAEPLPNNAAGAETTTAIDR